MNKLTPSKFLYITRINSFVETAKRQPTQNEKMEIYLKSEYDYKHASLHDRMIFEREVEIINDTNYANGGEERKTKKHKSKLNRKK